MKRVKVFVWVSIKAVMVAFASHAVVHAADTAYEIVIDVVKDSGAEFFVESVVQKIDFSPH